MAIAVVRFEHAATARWGVLFDQRIAPLSAAYATTGELIEHGIPALRALDAAQATLLLADVRLLSPITTNQQFVCQGINYASHVRESGMDPAKIPFNTIFTKASSCLAGPHDDVLRPAHVKLLDYEIELGLVMKRSVTQARATCSCRRRSSTRARATAASARRARCCCCSTPPTGSAGPSCACA